VILGQIPIVLVPLDDDFSVLNEIPDQARRELRLHRTVEVEIQHADVGGMRLEPLADPDRVGVRQIVQIGKVVGLYLSCARSRFTLPTAPGDPSSHSPNCLSLRSPCSQSSKRRLCEEFGCVPQTESIATVKVCF
jgi:hypothetical protein